MVLLTWSNHLRWKRSDFLLNDSMRLHSREENFEPLPFVSWAHKITILHADRYRCRCRYIDADVACTRYTWIQISESKWHDGGDMEVDICISLKVRYVLITYSGSNLGYPNYWPETRYHMIHALLHNSPIKFYGKTYHSNYYFDYLYPSSMHKLSRLHLCKRRLPEHYAKNKELFDMEKSKWEYHHIVKHQDICKNIIKTMKRLFSIMSNLQTHYHFKWYFFQSGPTYRRQVVNPQHQTP